MPWRPGDPRSRPGADVPETRCSSGSPRREVAQDQAIDVLKNGGATFVTMSPDTLSALKKAIEPVRQEWIAKAMEAGLSDPAAMLEFVENYKVAN